MLKRFIILIISVALCCSPVTVFGEQPLNCGATGAVIMEHSTGRVLYGKEANQPLPIASTTKIMTALITLSQPNQQEYFLVDSEAIRVEGSSMGLTVGDMVNLDGLAVGMLLSSGNDAANAAAVRISGSVPEFAKLMNETAKEIGMKDTIFVSPSGLDVGEHHSTAYDMALLASYALSNQRFAEIASSKSIKLSFGNPPTTRYLKNHNKLLGLSEDCIGVKTGFTKKAGRCLVSAENRDGLILIMVTLNCPDDFNTHLNAYETAFSQLEYFDVKPLLEGITVPVTGAIESAVPVGVSGDLGAFLTKEETDNIKLDFSTPPFVYAPIKKGQTIATVTATLDGVQVSKSPLIALEDRGLIPQQRRSISEKVIDFFNFPQYYGDWFSRN